MNDGFTYDRLVAILNYLVTNALILGGIIAVAAVIFYGFRMSLSRGDATQFTAAKNNLIKAVIGFALIAGVYTVIATVRGAADTLTH